MKVVRYITLVFFCVIWILGLSPELSATIGRWGLIDDSYRFGDLYRKSNLSAFKDPRKECKEYQPPVNPHTSRKTHLYIIGDSFTEKERISGQDFATTDYTYVHWSQILHVRLDTSKINILLLESVERHFREKMAATIRNLLPDSATFIQEGEGSTVMRNLDDAFKSENTEARLDEILFQNDVVLKLKEWKADFSYNVFHRVNKAVTLVNDDRDVVFYMDTDTPNSTSSFSVLKDSEVDSIVNHVNESQAFAKNIGFDFVILSVIPNKVSVLMPDYGPYNHLINRVYNHSSLQVPVVDVLEDFRKNARQSYLKGDSHWTCEAQYLWLTKANKRIIELVTPN